MLVSEILRIKGNALFTTPRRTGRFSMRSR